MIMMMMVMVDGEMCTAHLTSVVDRFFVFVGKFTVNSVFFFFLFLVGMKNLGCKYLNKSAYEDDNGGGGVWCSCCVRLCGLEQEGGGKW